MESDKFVHYKYIDEKGNVKVGKMEKTSDLAIWFKQEAPSTKPTWISVKEKESTWLAVRVPFYIVEFYLRRDGKESAKEKKSNARFYYSFESEGLFYGDNTSTFQDLNLDELTDDDLRDLVGFEELIMRCGKDFRQLSEEELFDKIAKDFYKEHCQFCSGTGYPDLFLEDFKRLKKESDTIWSAKHPNVKQVETSVRRKRGDAICRYCDGTGVGRQTLQDWVKDQVPQQKAAQSVVEPTTEKAVSLDADAEFYRILMRQGNPVYEQFVLPSTKIIKGQPRPESSGANGKSVKRKAKRAHHHSEDDFQDQPVLDTGSTDGKSVKRKAKRAHHQSEDDFQDQPVLDTGSTDGKSVKRKAKRAHHQSEDDFQDVAVLDTESTDGDYGKPHRKKKATPKRQSTPNSVGRKKSRQEVLSQE